MEYWGTERKMPFLIWLIPFLHSAQDKFTHYSTLPLFQHANWGEATKFGHLEHRPLDCSANLPGRRGQA